jgi:hypothetical protein
MSYWLFTNELAALNGIAYYLKAAMVAITIDPASQIKITHKASAGKPQNGSVTSHHDQVATGRWQKSLRAQK